MPIYTVTVDDGKGNIKTVTVDTETMEANVAPQAQSQTQQSSQVASVASVTPSIVAPVAASAAASAAESKNGGKRSAPSFRLKKRRITRKLKKTR